MTIMIEKLFQDARQFVRGISGHTDHFVGLEVAGVRYHGTLTMYKTKRQSRWLASISIFLEGKGLVKGFQVSADTAADALNQLEQCVADWAETQWVTMP